LNILSLGVPGIFEVADVIIIRKRRSRTSILLRDFYQRRAIRVIASKDWNGWFPGRSKVQLISFGNEGIAIWVIFKKFAVPTESISLLPLLAMKQLYHTR
jgi:hypothetical protein